MYSVRSLLFCWSDIRAFRIRHISTWYTCISLNSKFYMLLGYIFGRWWQILNTCTGLFSFSDSLGSSFRFWRCRFFFKTNALKFKSTNKCLMPPWKYPREMLFHCNGTSTMISLYLTKFLIFLIFKFLLLVAFWKSWWSLSLKQRNQIMFCVADNVLKRFQILIISVVAHFDKLSGDYGAMEWMKSSFQVSFFSGQRYVSIKTLFSIKNLNQFNQSVLIFCSTKSHFGFRYVV